MHFTPAPSHLHPHETQPCLGSSCTRCPGHGTHWSLQPAPPHSPAEQPEAGTQRGGWGTRADPPPQAPKRQMWGCQVLPPQLR